MASKKKAVRKKPKATAKLQVALDFLQLDRALKVAGLAVAGGADILEVGTPLLKSEGLDAVRTLRKKFPKHLIVCDTKTLDAGRVEMEAAAKAGANTAVVMAAACESTIRECVEAGANYGIDVAVDLLGIPSEETPAVARRMAELGAQYLCVHTPIDDQMLGRNPFDLVRAVRREVGDVHIMAAGGINSETAPKAAKAGADIVIVGGAIIKASDVKAAAREIKRSLETGRSKATTLFKRVAGADIEKIFRMVSTSNLSDAMHRGEFLHGLKRIGKPGKFAGRAVTVRTYPGDWGKPVQAIDAASPGEVIIIDAGGVGPAVWGELATESCVRKGIAGVVIDGGIRDTGEIAKLNFPAYARVISPRAGEPKGFGEIGVPVHISGIAVHPGDWIVGDEDGVISVPARKAVEIANRALDVLEFENRVRREIQEGSTLAQVAELLRWEKQL